MLLTYAAAVAAASSISVLIWAVSTTDWHFTVLGLLLLAAAAAGLSRGGERAPLAPVKDVDGRRK